MYLDYLIKTLQIQENYMMQLKHHFHKERDKIEKKSAEQIEQIEKSFISKAGMLINRHAYN